MRVKEESTNAGLKLIIQKTNTMASGPTTSWQIDGETMETIRDFIFLGCKITADGDWSHEIKRHFLLGRKAITKLDSTVKSRDITLPTKFCIVSYGFSSSHIWMWELDHKKGWAWKNWCLWIVVLKKTLQSPLDSKETKPVNPKGNQSWIFIERIDAEAPILWPPDVKSRLIEKDPNAGKDWRQRRRRQQKIRRLDSIIDSVDMNLSLECCSPCGHKELTWLSDWTTILARGASLVAQW